MPTKKLPVSPSLAHLKSQAHDLMVARPNGDPPVLQRIREFHPRFAVATDPEIVGGAFTLTDAQRTIAREYGFASWPRLKAFVESKPNGELEKPLIDRIEDPVLREAVARLDRGNVQALTEWIAAHPEAVHLRADFEGGNYFRSPSLLEFAPENPVRKGHLPAGTLGCIKVILAAGGGDATEALGLTASGSVARESGLQSEMIELLCRHGADPDRAMPAALAHGEFEAARRLLEVGAKETLDVAAALGRTEVLRRLLRDSTSEQRHRGLGFAANFGHAEIVKLLLESGEDPNRFNPVGAHSHSTPLHQAALAGHLEVVRVFLKHGARTDIRDTLWNGTALDWAKHGEQSAVVELIKSEHRVKVMNNKPMTAQEIVEKLRPMGRESYRKTMLKHGVHEPLLGVSIGDMQPIRKAIKKDYQIAKDLYATGIYDAMYLGGLVADEKRMTAADLENWMANSKCHAIATSTVAAVAAESAHGWELGLKWIESEDYTTQCAGWATLSGVVSVRENAALDLETIRALMKRIAASIHGQPDGIKYSMNNFVICVGAYVEPLAEEAMKVAEANGKMPIELVGDCKMPFAPEYIKKCQERGSLGKKKKMVRC